MESRRGRKNDRSFDHSRTRSSNLSPARGLAHRGPADGRRAGPEAVCRKVHVRDRERKVPEVRRRSYDQVDDAPHTPSVAMRWLSPRFDFAPSGRYARGERRGLSLLYSGASRSTGSGGRRSRSRDPTRPIRTVTETTTSQMTPTEPRRTL